MANIEDPRVMNNMEQATSTQTPATGHHFSRVKWPGQPTTRRARLVVFLNKVLAKLGFGLELVPAFDHRNQMVSTAQASNFQHLIQGVVDRAVPGAFVELGCYTGSTTAVIAGSLAIMDPLRELHVYDSFGHELGDHNAIRHTFEQNLQRHDLAIPTIHEGDLLATLPAALPERIAFAHFDLGVGGVPADHAHVLTHCLTSVYARMTPGAIGVLMDYYAPGITVEGFDANPGVRIACDAFFKGRPEEVFTLYGGPCSHGYFRKA